MIDSVLGLPLHPLVVHAAVVLLPMAALAVLVLVFVQRWRATYTWLTMGLVAAAAGAGVLAKEAGEQLAETVAVSADHVRWGDLLGGASIVFFLVAEAWLWWARRTGNEPNVPREVLRWAAAAVSVGILVLTVLAGHSGAAAVWGGQA